MHRPSLRGASSARRQRSARAVAALVLACAGAMVPIGTTQVSGQSLTCTSGTAVPNPSSNANLVADCEALLGFKSTLAGRGRTYLSRLVA